MSGMPLNISWDDIALRLALTVIAGLLIGYNRTEHGKAAGLRTTVLVCLAASVAMIQMNLLLPTSGRATDSFVMNDLMRLPLGILTGVGFIGGGVILRRDNLIVGVTTAATLWAVTVIGLCLGGGQIALGIAATAIALAALWVLQWIETRLRRERRVRLTVEIDGGTLNESAIRNMLEAAGLRIAALEVSLVDAGARRTFAFELLEFARSADNRVPPVCAALAKEAGVRRVDWKRP
jgi:putative Mg2+ transporter-C (MgtC) family protein